MKRERQVELLKRLRDADLSRPWPMASMTRRNTASAYTDPQRFARERAVLFRRRPQLLALSCELKTPGSYLTADLGGVPALIVRQQDSSLKGLVNACRHRGAPVAEQGGAPRPRFSCPYHGWVFDLDGSLVARPYAEPAFADAPSADCGLHQIAVAEGYGMIFAQAEGGEALTADTALHGAQSELEGYGLEHFVHVETRSQEVPFNWKLVLDTFTESYHIRALHKASIAPTYLSEASIYDSFGPHPRLIGLLKSVLEEIEKPEDEWALLPHGTTQCIFMPSGLITYQRDHIELWRVTPLAPDRTIVFTGLYAPKPPETEKARGYWKKNLDILLDVTGREDFPLMAAIQRNLASGALPEVIYGRNEPALIHLHSAIDEALAESV